MTYCTLNQSYIKDSFAPCGFRCVWFLVWSRCTDSHLAGHSPSAQNTPRTNKSSRKLIFYASFKRKCFIINGFFLWFFSPCVTLGCFSIKSNKFILKNIISFYKSSEKIFRIHFIFNLITTYKKFVLKIYTKQIK